MRAAVVREHGGTDTIEYRTDYPDPTFGAREVLIRVAATALNYHDILTRRGMPGIRVPMPLITGSDIAGELVEVAAGGEAEQQIRQRCDGDQQNEVADSRMCVEDDSHGDTLPPAVAGCVPPSLRRAPESSATQYSRAMALAQP